MADEDDDKPTPGPFTIRESPGGRVWFVETAAVERLALFKNLADARKFCEMPDLPATPTVDNAARDRIVLLARSYVDDFQSEPGSPGSFRYDKTYDDLKLALSTVVAATGEGEVSDATEKNA